MREPKIPNKYNLTIKDCKHLVVKDRSKVCEPIFWRNNVINAWCIIDSTAKNSADEEFGTYNECWIGVYDEDAPTYAGKVRFWFTSHGGMCGYEFDNFYDPAEIDCEIDLEIQERFLKKINMLLDEGILEVQNMKG